MMVPIYVAILLGTYFFIDFMFSENGIEFTESEHLIMFGALSTLSFCIGMLFALAPLKGSIRYLKKLLNQPKTENIRVEDVLLNQDNMRGEWIELSDLVTKVERKLRRRTKALLRETTELNAVMNSLGSPTIAITTNNEVSFLNSAFAVLFKVDLESIGKGQTDQSLDQIIDEPTVVQLLKSALEQENFEKRMIGLNMTDRKRIFSVTMSPLRRGVDNSLYGLVATFNDETKAVELDQKRMDFVSNASHELRTPIAAVSTSVSLLKRIEDEDTRKEIMESLELNTRRLVDLTNDLLDLSKFEDDAEELNLQRVELKQVTDEVIKGLESSKLAHKKVDVVYEVETGHFDVSKVKQVLTNLIRNARIYTAEDTKIEVRWSLDAEKENLILKVRDWGEGVLEAEHARIFERFYRVDKSRSRRSGGSGIGLSIVKHIMSLHGGEVGLEPYRHGEGASFVCMFPIK